MSTERFRLVILGADEDIPRLLAAQGKGCGGEVAFVLAPTFGRGLLVHAAIVDKKPVVRAWHGTAAPTALREMTWDVAKAKAELALVRAKGTEAAAGPQVLKGTWRGVLECVDGTPRVTLGRKIAPYAAIGAQSDPKTGKWVPVVELAERWFTKKGEHALGAVSTLREAITAALSIAQTHISQACHRRDTSKRNAVDAAFAADHPPRPARVPTRQPETGWAKAKRWTAPVLADLPAPTVPSCKGSVGRAAESVAAEAQSLHAQLDTVWSEDVYEVLGRAAKLVRYAQSLVASPLCKGKEKEAAVADVAKAVAAFDTAARWWDAGAATRWDPKDPAQQKESEATWAKLKTVAERTALAATRVAKACGHGQTKLWVPGTEPRRGPAVEAPGAPPASRPKRTRATRPAPSTPKVDAAKDKLLMGAFADAIRSAVAELGGAA